MKSTSTTQTPITTSAVIMPTGTTPPKNAPKIETEPEPTKAVGTPGDPLEKTTLVAGTTRISQTDSPGEKAEEPAPTKPKTSPLSPSPDLGLRRAIPGALIKSVPPPRDELVHVFQSSFNIRGVGIRLVEVPSTQNPKLDTESAWREVRKLFPTVGTNDIRRINSKVISRPSGGPVAIKIDPGMTIRQLFPDGTPFEASRVVGEVEFEGEPSEVILRHIRAKSVFSLTLKSKVNGNATRFGQQVTVMRLTSDLPVIISEMLEGNAPGLKFYFSK